MVAKKLVLMARRPDSFDPISLSEKLGRVPVGNQGFFMIVAIEFVFLVLNMTERATRSSIMLQGTVFFPVQFVRKEMLYLFENCMLYCSF
jgi:hypothetical protein